MAQEKPTKKGDEVGDFSTMRDDGEASKLRKSMFEIKPLNPIEIEADFVRRTTAGMTKEQKQKFFEEYENDGIPIPRDETVHTGYGVLDDKERGESIVEAMKRMEERRQAGEDEKTIVETVDGLTKLSLDDGCKRDSNGWVAPEKSCVIGKNPPKPKEDPKNMWGLIGVKSFPIGTPDEEMAEFKPNEDVVSQWEDAQRRLAEYGKENEGKDEVKECRQKKRFDKLQEIKKNRKISKTLENAARKKEAADRAREREARKYDPRPGPEEAEEGGD